MISKLFKFVLRVVLTLIVVGGLIGFAVTKLFSSPRPAAAVTPTAIPWGVSITIGNPPTVPPPPAPTPTPPPQPLPTAPTGQQVLLTGILDPCCTPAENWPVVLQVRQGLLFATEYRGENAYEELLYGPTVVRIISASAGWRHQNGYWHSILTVFYEDGTGANSLEFNTRHMFGR